MFGFGVEHGLELRAGHELKFGLMVGHEGYRIWVGHVSWFELRHGLRFRTGHDLGFGFRVGHGRVTWDFLKKFNKIMGLWTFYIKSYLRRHFHKVRKKSKDLGLFEKIPF